MNQIENHDGVGDTKHRILAIVVLVEHIERSKDSGS